ncbi:MAG: chromosome partitioning protein [Chloroflexi bacterium]|jgi:chromosome partitioning protein|nr:MAG: chromosome partitioning protein [Chloroflexota bacterium]
MPANIISISNQKGGVGKTTSAVSLSAGLALKGFKTLLIDCDPQGNASSSLGYQNFQDNTIYDILINEESIANVIINSNINKLYIVPSNKNLSGAEIELVDIINRNDILKLAVATIKNEYDYIIIDTPPALGILTINCLNASMWILIPVQVEYFALEGLNNLMSTIDLIRKKMNSQLEILGIILTMFDKRNRLSFEIEDEIYKHFNKLMIGTIPRSVRLAESPSHGVPIQIYDPKSTGSQAYNKVIIAIIEKMENVIK